MKFLLTKKVGMSQLFDPDGRVRAVTVLEAADNVITQVKTEETDGYSAVQVGFDEVRPSTLSKPEAGHTDDTPRRTLVEFRVENPEDFSKGDPLSVDTFEIGDLVTVAAPTVGKGFQGVVKRHGFGGAPASHGHRGSLRSPGSIGGAYPQRVFKGKKMAGRTGGTRTSIKNIVVVRVDPEKNLMFLEGSVPGKKGTVVEVTTK